MSGPVLAGPAALIVSLLAQSAPPAPKEVDPGDPIIVIDDAPRPPAPDGPRLEGRVGAWAEIALAKDLAHDRPREPIARLGLRAALEIDVRYGDARFFAAPRVEHISVLTDAGDARAQLYLRPPEAHLGLRLGPVDLRAGYLVYDWGTSDLVGPSDALNPLDGRILPTGPRDQTKLPLLSVEVAWTAGPLELTLVAAPVFQASRFHLVGWDLAIDRPGVYPLAAPTAGLERLYDAPTLDRVGDRLLVTDRPDDDPRSGTYGARLELHEGAFALGASWVHGWDPLPSLRIDPDLVLVGNVVLENLEDGDILPFGEDPAFDEAFARLQDKVEAGRTLFRGRWERRDLLGLDGSVALDPVVIGFDVAYTFARTFYTQRPDPVRSPLASGALSVEWIHGDRFFLRAEAFLLWALELPRGGRLLFLEERDPSIAPPRDLAVPGFAALGRWVPVPSVLAVEAAGGWSPLRGDWVFAPNLRWWVDDHHTLVVGGLFVGGGRESYGAAFGDLDEIRVAWRAAL